MFKFFEALFNFEETFEKVMKTISVLGFQTVFFIEKQFGVSANFLHSVELVVLAFAFVLLSCKLLFKLFNVYTLGVDGDSSVSPLEYLKSYAKGIVLAICFTTIYGWIGDVCTDFVVQLNNAIGEQVDFVISPSSLFAIVFFITFITVYINCLMMGVRLLFLRISIPLACVGLIDNDNGIYSTFMKKLFQTVITVIAQLSLMRISFVPLMVDGANSIFPQFLSIAIVLYAHKIAADLNDIFLATPATGAGQKISALGRGAQVLTSIVGRK